MALSKAIEFIHAASLSSELRDSCSNFTKEKLFLKLNFNEIEFEDAINMQLVESQTFEQAEVFQEIRFWFKLL